MPKDNAPVIEFRVFAVVSGKRDEFHRISADGTVPLMRAQGIRVLAHGPALNSDDEYFLIRTFDSEQHRLDSSAAFYETDEWKSRWESVVPPLIVDYHTTVLPATADIGIRG
jgi:hypothetical protein